MTIYDIIIKKYNKKTNNKIINKKKTMVNIKIKTNTLNADKKIIIDKKIEQLRKNYPELDSAGFDLISFLEKYYKFIIVEVPLNDDTTGMIAVDDINLLNFKKYETHRIIIINSELHKKYSYIQKRRFIIAHEFGHFVLHKEDSQVQLAKRDTEHFNNAEELEAEYFARSILMPEEKVKQLMNLFPNASISDKVNEVMRMFNVTENKARYRLQELNLV